MNAESRIWKGMRKIINVLNYVLSEVESKSEKSGENVGVSFIGSQLPFHMVDVATTPGEKMKKSNWDCWDCWDCACRYIVVFFEAFWRAEFGENLPVGQWSPCPPNFLYMLHIEIYKTI
jgi:hypothetical protein